MTSQGVNNASFGEQLASTAAAFDLLAPSWPADYKPTAKREFELALGGWKLLYQLWRRDIISVGHLCYDDRLIDAVEAYAPEHIKYEGDSTKTIRCIPYSTNVAILMVIASDHFQAGRAIIQGSEIR